MSETPEKTNGPEPEVQQRTPAEIRRQPLVVQDDVTFLFDTARFEQLQRLASVMAACKTMPNHLKGSVSDCFRVASQALRWQMDPFAICDKTYEVGGKLAYEGQLIAAVVNLRAGLERRLAYRYTGDPKTPASLSVIVAGKFRGEDQERTIEATWIAGQAMSKGARDKWSSQPEQQLSYFAARVWARRHCPEIILGAYTPEELLDDIAGIGPENARDVTPSLERAPPRPRREDFVAPQALDPEPEPFEVIDMAGNVLPYPTLSNAVAEYRLSLAEGEKHGGESGLTTVWDNNQGFMRQLDERGHEALSKELSLEYGRMREKAAARATPSAPLSPAAGGEPEAPNTDSSPNPNPAKEVMPNEKTLESPDKTAPPVMGATAPRGGPEPESAHNPAPRVMPGSLQEELDPRATPAATGSRGEGGRTVGSIPATGANPAGLTPPPRRQPRHAQMDAMRETAHQSRLGLGVPDDPPERPSLAIKPVESQGKPEWHVWLVSQLLPALKATTTSNQLADLLGHNEQYIADALKILPKEDIAELHAARSHQWDAIGKREASADDK